MPGIMSYYIDPRYFTVREQEEIMRIISDTRGWVGRGYRFRRVYDMTPRPDIVIIKLPRRAMRGLFGRDPELRGFSVTQTTAEGHVIYIDATNWLHIPKNFHGSLQTYRQYLVQHEIGHCLGYGHVPATMHGRLCPVMYQQTRGTQTCRANPWSIY